MGEEERFVRLAERLEEKLDSHSQEFRDWRNDHDKEHRLLDRFQVESMSSLRDGNSKFVQMDQAHAALNRAIDEVESTLEDKIEETRKERSKGIYWIFGLLAAAIPAIIGALWTLRGSLDEKADQAIVDTKADKADLRVIQENLKEILSHVNPPKGKP